MPRPARTGFLPLCLAAAILPFAVLSARAQVMPATTGITGADRCAAAASQLDGAIAVHGGPAIQAAAAALLRLPGCDDGVRLRLRHAASRALVALALDAHAHGLPAEATMQQLQVARRIGQVWDTTLAMADVAFEQRDFTTATRFYQDALNEMDETAPGEPPVPQTRYAYAYQRADETQMLAPSVLPPPRRDGSGPGGLDAALSGEGSRNIAVVPRFLPVTYVTDRAEMTEDGRHFAEQWWGSLQTNSPPALVLVGHTDPRGSDAYNNNLSLARAKALAMFLQAQGYTGSIRVIGFGKRCPVTFSEGAVYTEAEQYQILRRVEVFRGTSLPSAYCQGQTGGSAP